MRTVACQIFFPLGSAARIISSAPNAFFQVSIASAQPSTVNAGVTLCSPSGIAFAMLHLQPRPIGARCAPQRSAARAPKREPSVGSLYRFENWKRLRAPGRPYFLRSTTRASRVRKPAFFSAGRKSGFSLVSARLMPCRMAPAWPESPPPQTFTEMSTLPTCSTTSSGCLRIILLVSRPKYSSRVRSLTTNSPEPGFRRTRAIDSLRRPVAVTSSSLLALGIGRFHRGRLLGGVRVLVAGIDLQLLHESAAQVGAGQHAPDGVLDQPGGVARHRLLGRVLAEPARVLRVVDVLLVLPLVAGEPDLLGVHHHHEIPAVRVGREGGLVLAAQDARDGGRGAAQHLVLHVDDHPVALDGLLAAHHGLHAALLSKRRRSLLDPEQRVNVRRPLDSSRTGARPCRRRSSGPCAFAPRPRPTPARSGRPGRPTRPAGRRGSGWACRGPASRAGAAAPRASG